MARRSAEECLQRLRSALADQGHTLLETEWRGSGAPHKVRCAQGHTCYPYPLNVMRGVGACETCAKLDRDEKSLASLQALLATRSVELIEPKWLGKYAPHRARCARNHHFSVTPDFYKKVKHLCQECADEDSLAALKQLVSGQGGELREAVWLGAREPHKIRCAAGHESTVRPDQIKAGVGICGECVGKIWDAFYVVVNLILNRVKFGISSGDLRPRLRKHRRDGYTEEIFKQEGLPDGLPKATEDAVKAALKDAGFEPVQGTEYFDISALGQIMDIVEGWLGDAEAA